MTPSQFFRIAELIPWLILFFYWVWMWREAKPTAQEHPDRASQINRFFMVVAAILLWSHRFDIGWLGYVLIPRTLAKAVTGLSVTVIGVAIAIWARKILADNWSAQPTLKQNHELIQTGPYKIVRHPIYTGIIIAILGTAIMVGHVRGFIALAIVFFSLWHKSTFEEDLMRQQFPRQYDDYARRVKRLIPFIF
jgi:protein-S-isoprenylcysteine O-methyltransferase Ste14